MGAASNSRVLRIVPLLLTIGLAGLSSAARYSGGDGTAKVPYRIATVQDLIALSDTPTDWDKHFILVNDVDLDPGLAGRRLFGQAVIAPNNSEQEEDFQGWAFTGTFDGDSHVIRRLTISGDSYLGLFGQLASGAEVRNLGLTDANVTGSGPCIGALAGCNNGGRVIQCSSAGAIHGSYFVGGLLGDNRGVISENQSTGKVSGDMHVGGLAGYNGGRVTDSTSTVIVDAVENTGGLIAYNAGDLYRSNSSSTVRGVSGVGGLVGENYGEVRNSHSMGSVSGQVKVGGLVGHNGGSVTGSFNGGSVVGKVDIGGLVGDNSGGIFACFSTGPVRGQENVGGLVGHNSGEESASGPAGHHDVYSSILCSYSTGPVTADVRVGGLVGENAGAVVSSYSAGAVTGYWKAFGGLIGSNDWPGSVSNCFWDTATSRQSSSDGGTGLTTFSLQYNWIFLQAGWDFLDETANGLHQTWQMPAKGGYPVLSILNGWEPAALRGQGTPSDPYLISTALDLASLAYQSQTASYKLTADLALSGITWSIPVIPLFRGRFNGNGFAIIDLTIYGTNYLGLFGRLSDRAEVRDLAVLNTYIWSSGDRVGSLAGHNQESSVANCHSEGEVYGYECVGGLVGSSYYGTVADSSSHGLVTGYSLVGGLVGDNMGGVNNSRSSGNVTGSDYTGGLVGLNEGISLGASYSIAEVTGRAFVGGLIGSNWLGDVANCYSTGRAAGRESVGGLAGQNTGAIGRCYSTGVPTGDLDVGGLVGDNRGGITASFWDIETSGRTNMCSGQKLNAWGCDDRYGQTTAQMHAAVTFLNARWDFVGETGNGADDLWWILEGQDYPRLFWQLPGDDWPQHP
jgi:hypothetical protein